MNVYSKKEVADFYDDSVFSYSLFAYNQGSLSIHYGFWGKKTKNQSQAMLNEIRNIIELGKIKKSNRILDAGCGVGGSAIFIAQKTGAKVTGISLSPKQIQLAKKYALKKDVSQLTSFYVKDYNKTNFPNNYFDVVYGIESICHAYPKSSFLKEAFRILKPKGKLIISDGYRKRGVKNKEEKKIIECFKYGFCLTEMITVESMSKQIKLVGFKKVRFYSKIKEVTPSVEHFYKISKFFYFPALILKNLHPIFLALYRNGVAATNAYKAIKTNLADYGVHLAEKPEICYL